MGSDFFTIKLHYSGELDEKGEHYNGRKIAYFDMCWRKYLTLGSLQKMLSQSGLELGNVSLWYLLPQVPLRGENLKPVETENDVEMVGDFIDSYSNKVKMYATISNGISGAVYYDFPFTQYELDERERRVEEIREECDVIGNVPRAGDLTAEEPIGFFPDTSNVDTTETETAPLRLKRRRTVPPPNPPYRARRRGRYSMLRVRILLLK